MMTNRNASLKRARVRPDDRGGGGDEWGRRNVDVDCDGTS